MDTKTVEIGDQYAKEIYAAFLKWAALQKKRYPKWSKFDLLPHIEGAAYASIDAQAEWVKSRFKIGYSFNLRSPEAEKWIKRYAAKEIKFIDAASRQSIKQIIAKGFSEGLTSQEQAKLIMPHIGLDPRRSQALATYSMNLGIEDEGQILRLTERYGRKLLKDRAMNIAITEGHIASNQGYLEATASAVDRGIIDPAIYEYIWILTHDDRTCYRCRAHEGDRAEIPRGSFKGGDEPGHIHNRDRCCRGIVRK